MLYRICTEDKNRQGLETVVGMYYDGFTILSGRGYWKGTAENSLVIEIVAEEEDAPKILALAENIKIKNGQESVLVQAINCKHTFV